MPRNMNLEKLPRPALNIFFVLVASGEMTGFRGALLNHAMEETVETMKELAGNCMDARIMASFLTYGSGCRWLNPDGPESMEGDFVWSELSAGGLADMGAALQELDRKLTRREFLNDPFGTYLPVILFLSCRYATDNYRRGLQILQKNKWFQRAKKIAFALGDENLEMLCSIVGSGRAVFQCPDLFNSNFSEVLKSAVLLLSKFSMYPDLLWLSGDGDWLGALRDSGIIPKKMFVPGVDEYDIESPPDLTSNFCDGDDEDDWW